MAPAKKAAAKKPTSIVKWDEKFSKYAKEAKAQVANVGTSGLSISFGHGEITVGGNVIKGGKLECVVVGSCALNKYYKTAYNAQDKQPPDCYALAVISDDPEMVPHAQATDKQSAKCADCDKNVFGSAATGKGKACGNTIRLGLLTAADAADADSIAAAEIGTAGVSPTNRRYYSEYVDKLLEEYGRPPWAVVTEITSLHDAKTQIKLEFRMVSLIEDDDILEALEKRYEKIQPFLQRPFSAPIERSATTPVAKSKKFAGKGKK